MISFLIFDLDGTILDAKQIHKDCLNRALATIDQKYVITEDEQNTTYEALPTKNKLVLLTANKGLPVETYEQVYTLKQQCTIEAFSNLKKDERIYNILATLKNEGYKLCVASNSIRQTIEVALDKLGISELFEFIVSNQDVARAKPNCEMFLKAFINFGCSPKECLIVEDSPVGKQAALDSAAYLCPVTDPRHLTYELIKSYLNIYNKPENTPYQGGAMNIVIPMSGRGSRFAEKYSFPKPLIPINCLGGSPMVQMVVNNLNCSARFIFIVQKEHMEKYHLRQMLNAIAPNCEIVILDGQTEGACISVLAAQGHFNNDNPLVIANSDQFLEWNSHEFFNFMTLGEADAGIATFGPTRHPRWSFAELGDDGFVKRVAEKDPISDIANTGVHWFRRGKDFISMANMMILNNERVNGEFYVTPVLNSYIQNNKKVSIFPIKRFFGTGTPEDLSYFEEHYKP